MRHLQNVYLNISTTLYMGLRPNTVMASLRGSVMKLGVRFGENMDKRMVEKMLGVVAAILGSGLATSSEVMGTGMVGVAVKGMRTRQGKEAVGEGWKGWRFHSR
jgi:hypothetical protein